MKDLKAIHLYSVNPELLLSKRNRRPQIHVIHHHVVQMLNVSTVTADVLPNIKEIHSKVAVQNAQQTLSVAATKHAYVVNA